MDDVINVRAANDTSRPCTAYGPAAPTMCARRRRERPPGPHPGRRPGRRPRQHGRKMIATPKGAPTERRRRDQDKTHGPAPPTTHARRAPRRPQRGKPSPAAAAGATRRRLLRYAPPRRGAGRDDDSDDRDAGGRRRGGQSERGKTKLRRGGEPRRETPQPDTPAACPSLDPDRRRAPNGVDHPRWASQTSGPARRRTARLPPAGQRRGAAGHGARMPPARRKMGFTTLPDPQARPHEPS